MREREKKRKRENVAKQFCAQVCDGRFCVCVESAKRKHKKKQPKPHNGEIGGRKERESVLCESQKAKKKGKR